MSMSEMHEMNPADIAAKKALNEMFECIRARQSFRLEAGAGAGKTYSLVKALKFIVDNYGTTFERYNQRVACITYTNIAKDEIVSRTDGHPVVYASTIHSFCWGLIKSFQPVLRTKVSEIEAWSEKLSEVGGVGTRNIDYELGHRHVSETRILLHHDDVLTLTVALMEQIKFCRLFAARFPVLFIDEYQDTNSSFADSIIEHYITLGVGPLIGLFGDSWQKIYNDGKGLIDHENIKYIGKGANFRSDKNIVEVLNRIRASLPQEARDPSSTGVVRVYHTNAWPGNRRTGSHWAGDLPADVARDSLERLRQYLMSEGWDFSPQTTKILMLTHNVLAEEQSYVQIANAFRYNESFLKKEDPYISFLIDTVEPARVAFQNGRYAEMFTVLGSQNRRIESLQDKQGWAKDMRSLTALCDKGTIGEVLDLLNKTRRPRLPEAVKKTEAKLTSASDEEIKESLLLSQVIKLRAVAYSELVALALFLNNHTPFATKHGVKGAEFENVLVVFGRGWNHYDWNKFLEWFPDGFPVEKAQFYERNRNLFYVACSRPKKRLVLLFTQKLSEEALGTLGSWFGAENVHSMPYV